MPNPGHLECAQALSAAPAALQVSSAQLPRVHDRGPILSALLPSIACTRTVAVVHVKAEPVEHIPHPPFAVLRALASRSGQKHEQSGGAATPGGVASALVKEVQSLLEA